MGPRNKLDGLGRVFRYLSNWVEFRYFGWIGSPLYLLLRCMIGIDLFSGAGGMSLGARQAGISVALAVESDPHAARTYAANHPGTEMLTRDIRRLTNSKLKKWAERCDEVVVFGGPPCQGFSWSNVRTRSASNESNWLFQEFIRVVRAIRPAWVVFENVQGLVNTANGVFLAEIRSAFDGLGYKCTSRLLNAMHFGVLQDRTRFFLVGSRDGIPFRFPRKRPGKVLTVDDAIRDLPRLKNGDSICWRPYGAKQPRSYARRLRGDLEGCCNHVVSNNAEYVIQGERKVSGTESVIGS